MNRRQTGFTTIELIVVTVMTALLSGVILLFSVSYLRFGGIIQSDSLAFIERLNASDYLRENLGLASGLIDQNSIDDPNVPPSVADTDPQHWKKLYPVADTFGDSTDITPIIYFKKLSKNTAGSLVKNGLLIYEDEYVLYHDGAKKQLRVRTLANGSVTNNSKRTSYPDALISNDHPADAVIMSDISSVKLRYFSRAGLEVSITSHDQSGVSPCESPYPYATCDGATFSAVEVVELTLNLSKIPLGTQNATTKSATIVRVALRNK